MYAVDKSHSIFASDLYRPNNHSHAARGVIPIQIGRLYCIYYLLNLAKIMLIILRSCQMLNKVTQDLQPGSIKAYLFSNQV